MLFLKHSVESIEFFLRLFVINKDPFTLQLLFSNKIQRL